MITGRQKRRWFNFHQNTQLSGQISRRTSWSGNGPAMRSRSFGIAYKIKTWYFAKSKTGLNSKEQSYGV